MKNLLLFATLLLFSCAILSEENEENVQTGNEQGKYVVAMDPLDGSSNIDVNVSIGTIFSIYRRVSGIGGPARVEDFLHRGQARRQAAPALRMLPAGLPHRAGRWPGRDRGR